MFSFYKGLAYSEASPVVQAHISHMTKLRLEETVPKITVRSRPDSTAQAQLQASALPFLQLKKQKQKQKNQQISLN